MDKFLVLLKHFLLDTAPVFLKAVNMCITASYVILAIFLVRALLKKTPKRIICLFWILAAIRLTFPFSFECSVSMIPNAAPFPEKTLYSEVPSVNSGFTEIDEIINPIIRNSLPKQVDDCIMSAHDVAALASLIWLTGITVMLCYAIGSVIKIRRSTREAVPHNNDSLICDHIPSPFVFGFIRPKIYLPSELDGKISEYVVEHEKAHIARRDYIWKPLGFFLLSVYWFNPLIWIAYFLFCRDIELACDERVIAKIGAEMKKPYSEALISCSVKGKAISACPIAFSETNVKNRVKNILKYKKASLPVILITAAVLLAATLCLLTNPISDSAKLERITKERGYSIIGQSNCDFQITISKNDLPADIYINEGHTFQKNEVIVYQTDTTSICLERVMPANEGENYLYFIFDFSYALPENGEILYPYYINNPNYILSNIFLRRNTLTADNESFDDSVSLRAVGPGTQFTFYVSTEAVRKAKGNLRISAFCTRLTYRKGRIAYQTVTATNIDPGAADNKMLGTYIFPDPVDPIQLYWCINDKFTYEYLKISRLKT